MYANWASVMPVANASGGVVTDRDGDRVTR
jgi:hypothetical protein